MAQNGCFNKLYEPYASNVSASSNTLIVTNIHAVQLLIPDTGRPFIPLYGVSKAVIDGQDTYSPLSVAANQTVAAKRTFLELAFECYKASLNVTYPPAVNTSIITSQYFEQYLSRRLYGKAAELSRFVALYMKVYDFWTNADPAWTASQYYANITALINKLITEADKGLYIPNGQYNFDLASQFATNYNLFETASPTLAGIASLEFYP